MRTPPPAPSPPFRFALLALLALLTLLALGGCALFETPGLGSVTGNVGNYGSDGFGPAELRLVLPAAGILGGRGAIDSSGVFTLELQGNLTASVLPRVTAIGIGGADLFGVSVSDRDARLAIGEIGVYADGVDVGFLLLGNLSPSTPIDADGVVLAQLVYADRAISLEGTAQGDGTTVNYSADMPRGWSFLTVRRGASGEGPTPYSVTTAPVSGLTWLFDPE